MNPYKPTIGAISSGTLRTIDLLESFADELARIEPEHALVKEACAVLTLANSGWIDICDSQEASELLHALMDQLTEHAPSHCYFGVHETDGACFGYWPNLNDIDEFTQIDDPSEAADHEECVFVDKDTTVTFYQNGKVVWQVG